MHRLRALTGIARDPLGFVAARFARYGDTYHVDEGGGGHLYATRDPRVIQDVLVTRAAAFRKAGGVNDRLRRILGEGLLTADGETWRRKRRLIQPSFRQKSIAAYAETMRQAADAVAWSDGDVVDLSSEMMTLTLRIVCRALFDHDVRGQTDVVAGTMDALRDGVQPGLVPGFVPTPRRRRLRKALREVDGIIDGMIASRRDADGTDLLSVLVRAGLPPREIRDELVTFFLAGHETTSHALTWTWRLLVDHPAVLTRVEAELEASLAGRLPTVDDLPRLVELDAVIREGLRLYPPAFAVGRVAGERTAVGGYPMEPGWQVVCWIWHCHRNPAYYQDHDAFRPQRHRGGSRVDAPWLPFGAGTRKCIGAGFAEMEMRLLLATLLERYRLEPLGPFPTPRPRVTLGPAGPVWMRVRRRG